MDSQPLAKHSKQVPKVLLVLTGVIAALGLQIASGGIAAAQANVCPANPSPPNAADPAVIVDQPAAGARVTSPVTISGRARVFEANVRITIFDAAGNVLVDTFTTAAEAGPALAPYSAQVSFTTATAQRGCIRVFEESAMDGSPVNVVQVEVTLAPSTTPPGTGSAGLQERPSRDSDLAFYAGGAIAIAAAVALALKRRLWS